MANLKNLVIDDAYIKLPVGGTYQRPLNPPLGAIRFNQDRTDIELNINSSTLRGNTASPIWTNASGSYVAVPIKGLVIHLDYHMPFLIQNPIDPRSSINLATKIPTSTSNSQQLNTYINNNVESTFYLSFNGNADQSFVIHEGANLRFSKNQTINFWIRPATRSLLVRENFYNQAYGGDGTITLEPDGSLNYYYGTAGGDNNPYQTFSSNPAYPVTSNQWQMYTIVRDLESSTLKWYKNATLINSSVANYTYALPSTNVITIGNGYTSPYTGELAMLSVWREALTANDISNIFESSKQRYDA